MFWEHRRREWSQVREGTDICAICGKSVCKECGLEIAGKIYCKECLEKIVGLQTDEPL